MEYKIMKEIKINLFITEGCRLTHNSGVKLAHVAESIFRNNGFDISLPITNTTYIEKEMDNGTSIYNMDLHCETDTIVNENPHLIGVEKHKEVSLFDDKDINLVLVKSLHDVEADSWFNSFTFSNTNTIFVSESCYDTSFAHSLMNHFGIENQYHDPACISYGFEILRSGVKMSEYEKLILSEELNENIINL